MSWITALHEVTAGQLVAIDGKTLRQSFDKADAKSAIHMVSAWATANQISLGQVAVAEKSNEITAIPKLLELLELSGCAGDHRRHGLPDRDRREDRREAGRLRAGRQGQPADPARRDRGVLPRPHGGRLRPGEGQPHETKEKGHGRDEHRTYYVCDVPEDLPDRARWEGLKRIGVAISDTVRGGKPCDDVRFYILSKKLSARSFGAAVRGHWGIENSLHWQLDMSFGEDRSRVRKDHADANMAALRRMALGLLKNEKSKKVGIKNKRLTAAGTTTICEQVLFGA